MFEVGTIIAGKFRIERILGQGGMGIVAVATHLQLEQRVAIKVMREQLTTDSTIVERFLREAQASAKLRSDHVCRVTDVGQLDNGAPYIVMELLEGSDLASVINRGALPIATAVEYVLQACIAIAEAHAHGIIHRDLKPANLFLTKQLDDTPLVKVLDFGIAKAASKSDHALTQTEALMGSPGYMSPEQLRSARDVDARTDVWALGVILYQLVAGRVPFPADSITELAVKVAMDPPDPLDVDPAFRAVVFRCLEKPAADRYPDVATLARALLPFGGPRSAEHLALIERIARSRAAPDAMASTLPAAGSAKSVDPMAKTAASMYGETAAASIPPTTTLQGAAGHAETQKAPRSRAWIGALAIAVAASTITVVVTRDKDQPSISNAPPPVGSAAADPANVAQLRARLTRAVGSKRCSEATELSTELYKLGDVDATKLSTACLTERMSAHTSPTSAGAAAILLAEAEEAIERGRSAEARNSINVALDMSGDATEVRALAIKVACKDKDLDTARITFAALESIELRSEASAYCAALGIALVPGAQPQVAQPQATTGKSTAPPKPKTTPKAADPIPADWSRQAGNAMMSGDYKGAREIVLAVLAKEPNNEHAAYVATGAYCMLDDAVNAKKWAAKLSDEMRAKAARFSCSMVKIDIGIDWVKYEREKDAKEKAAEPSTDKTDADRTAAPTNERLDLLQEARAANQSGNWTLSLALAEQILADRPTDRNAAHIATVAACYLNKPVLAKKYAAILTPEKRRELQNYICAHSKIQLE